MNANNKAPIAREALRQQLLAARTALPVIDRQSAQRRLQVRVAQWLQASDVRVLGFYLPIKGEPEVTDVVAQWLAADRARCAAVPVISDQILRFARWQPDTALQRGPMGVLIPQTPEFVSPQALLIPCVGVDAQRYRLGYGGGYYDRSLAALAPRPTTVGIAFSCSVLDSIYPQAHDLALDVALTDRGQW